MRLGTGMGAIVDLVDVGRSQMRVDLGGAQALMAEQFLHAAEIRAGVEKVRGEGVP